MEDWRDIPDFPGWVVSSTGKVQNTKTGKLMTPRQNKQGVTMVNLVLDGEIFTRSLGLLVGHAFLPSPKNPFYNSVIHLNGDRTDCTVDNLTWRPRGFAQYYHRMFMDKPYNVAVYLCDTDEVFPTLREACVKYGLIEKQVYRNMLNMEPCFHYGWLFRRYRE